MTSAPSRTAALSPSTKTRASPWLRRNRSTCWTPASRAASEVPSVEPSSMTRISISSIPGISFGTSATTWGRLCASLRQGICTTSFIALRCGVSPGLGESCRRDNAEARGRRTASRGDLQTPPELPRRERPTIHAVFGGATTRIRADSRALQRRLRARMLNTMFAGVSEGAFHRCLELGAGDGFLSPLLARHARVLFATEIRLGGLREAPPDNVRYAFCDAELLPFRSGTFDLIFTSHLLEHLSDLQGALSDMRRTLDEKGVMVLLVPSRLWKIFDLGLFLPSQIVHVLEVYTAPEGLPRAPKGMRSTVKTAPAGWWRRSFWPSVHGVSSSNVAELRRF